MATRTVRLDEDAERTLKEITKTTGMPISSVLKEGLVALRDRLRDEASKNAFEIYQELDLGEGGYANAPSTETRRGVLSALKKRRKP